MSTCEEVGGRAYPASNSRRDLDSANLSLTTSRLKDQCQEANGQNFLSVLGAGPLGLILTQLTLNLGASAAPAVSRDGPWTGHQYLE